jgi:hypothetical protein
MLALQLSASCPERQCSRAHPGEVTPGAFLTIDRIQNESGRARGLEAVIAVEARGGHVRDGLALAGKQTSALVRSRILLGVAQGILNSKGIKSLAAALTAGCSCGAAYATTSSERPAASSHLSSHRRRGRGHHHPDLALDLRGRLSPDARPSSPRPSPSPREREPFRSPRPGGEGQGKRAHSTS